MKNLFAFILFLFPFVAGAQSGGKTFRLEGRLTGELPDSIYLHYRDDNGAAEQKAVVLKERTFSYSGKLDYPRSATLTFKKGSEKNGTHYAWFFLEPGTITVEGDMTKPDSFVVTGSKTELENKEYKRQLDAVKHDMKGAMAVTEAYMMQHPHSYLTVNLLETYMFEMSLDTIKMVYQSIDSVIRNTAGKDIAVQIRRMQAGSPGSKITYFSTTDVHGAPFSLASYKGKYILLDFWGSWCHPCRASHPHLRAIYSKYKDKGLEMVGIAADDNTIPAWKEAVEKDSIGVWTQVLAGADWELMKKGVDNPKDLATTYGVTAFPTKLLIDPSGTIIGRYLGDSGGKGLSDLDQKLDAIFK